MKHLSDRVLLLASDGELRESHAADALAHLDACWTCRERLLALQQTGALFAAARNNEAASIPPTGPREVAAFRARMAAEPTMHGGVLRRTAFAAVAFASVVCLVLFSFQSSVNAEGPRPKAKVTPGETRPITIAEVCEQSGADVAAADIPDHIRQQVFSAYGIDAARRNEFEVDYLITRDLGGAESIRNLWPQPYSARWNAHVKDKLEQRLHHLVCEGKVDLSTAQHDLAADWIRAYRKYVDPRQ